MNRQSLVVRFNVHVVITNIGFEIVRISNNSFRTSKSVNLVISFFTLLLIYMEYLSLELSSLKFPNAQYN